jgi:hypothetical protein
MVDVRYGGRGCEFTGYGLFIVCLVMITEEETLEILLQE